MKNLELNQTIFFTESGFGEGHEVVSQTPWRKDTFNLKLKPVASWLSLPIPSLLLSQPTAPVPNVVAQRLLESLRPEPNPSPVAPSPDPEAIRWVHEYVYMDPAIRTALRTARRSALMAASTYSFGRTAKRSNLGSKRSASKLFDEAKIELYLKAKLAKINLNLPNNETIPCWAELKDCRSFDEP